MITFLLPETTIEVIYNPRQEKAQGCNTIAEKCPLDEQGGNLLSTGKQAKWPTGRGKGKDEPSCRAALCPEPKLSLCMDYLLSTTRTMACKVCETKKWGLEAIDSIPKCEITEISIRLITNGLYEENKRRYRVSVTGYQNTPLQNTPFWHKDSFKLKSTENWQMLEELSVLRLAGWTQSSSYEDGPSPVLNQEEKDITRDSDGSEISQATKQTAHMKPYLPLVSAIYLPSHNWPEKPKCHFFV